MIVGRIYIVIVARRNFSSMNESIIRNPAEFCYGRLFRMNEGTSDGLASKAKFTRLQTIDKLSRIIFTGWQKKKKKNSYLNNENEIRRRKKNTCENSLTIDGWKKGHAELVQFGKNLHGVGLAVISLPEYTGRGRSDIYSPINEWNTSVNSPISLLRYIRVYCMNELTI